MINDKLTKALNQQGINSFNSIGEDFDIDLHEGIMLKKSKKKSNKIINEFEKGFKYNGKVIRHAKVIVSK